MHFQRKKRVSQTIRGVSNSEMVNDTQQSLHPYLICLKVWLFKDVKLRISEVATIYSNKFALEA